MKLQVQLELLKFCFAVSNSVFLVLGLAVMGCGIWILFDTGSLLNVLSSDELRVVAAGLFMAGGVVALVSLTGCVAAILEKRFLLLVYLAFLIVLVLGQLYITFMLLFNRDKIDQKLSETVDRIVSQYGNGSDSGSRIMDNVQHFTKCCGRTGPDDWLQNSFLQTLNLTTADVLPCSCFRSFPPDLNSSWCTGNSSFTGAGIGLGNGTFSEGCSQNIAVWLQENILTIVAMDGILIALQIVQLSIAGSLFRKFAQVNALKKSRRLADEDHAHLDSSSSCGGGGDPNPDSGEQNYAYVDPDGRPADPNYAYVHPDGRPADPNYAYVGEPNGIAHEHYNQNQGYHGYQQVQHF